MALLLQGLCRRLLVHLADASLRAICLALVVLAVLWLLRNRQPAFQHAVWTALVCAMLVLPFATAVLPSLSLGIAIFPAQEALPLALLGGSGTFPLALTPQTLGIQAPPSGSYWPVALAILYLGVALGLLVRFVAGFCGIQRFCLNSEPVREPRVVSLVEDVAAAYSVGWPLPDVRESPDVVVPLTVRWRAPVIVLPAAWHSWGDGKVRAILAHELAHIRRSDWAIAMLASLNKCLFWFHPLAWWLERRLRTLAELASDEAAIRLTRDAPRYALVVLGFASALRRAGGRRILCGPAMLRAREVTRRIERILGLAQAGSGILSKPRWVAICACMASLLYASAAAQLGGAPVFPGDASSKQVQITELMAEGQRMSSEAAEKLEQELTLDPENLDIRLKLISYYFLNSIPQPRLDHIFWLIDHHPESAVAVSLPTTLTSRPTALNSAADYERAKALWLRKASIHASDTRVLGNAAAFLQRADPAVAERLLKRARSLEPSNPQWTSELASLYVTAISATLQSSASAGATVADPSTNPTFVAGAKRELETTIDATFVGTAGELMAERAEAFRRSFPNQEAEGKPLVNYAELLLKRAGSLEPFNGRWRAALVRLRQPE